MNATEIRTEYPNGRFNIDIRTGTTYGDRCASVTKQGDADYLAIFGHAAHDWRGGFQFDVATSSPSRSYRTEAGARRAVAKWRGAAL